MTDYTCPAHGDIGTDVLNTQKLFDLLHHTQHIGDGHTHISTSAYPKQELICARCLKALIDDQFAPVREKRRG